ncbi:MAG: exo-alpha-sialidase [Caldilineaceae bacterium]|nr:exo-alpha-sialidase [Caldilineaceae bacterium]
MAMGIIHEHLWEVEQPFRQCHASTVVQLAPERFLVAWFGGTAEGRDDVAIWSAIGGPGDWTPPRCVAKVRDDAHWNPVLFAAPGGTIYLFFKVGKTIPSWETWWTETRDGGETWTPPVELVAGDRGGRGPVKNKPIVLADGSWLAGSSVETDRAWNVFVDRSEDRGQSWSKSVPLSLDRTRCDGLGVIQPALWESAPSQVHMLVRSTCRTILRADSVDGGRTWSPLYPIPVPNNNSGLDVARLPDGRLVLVCTPLPTRERTPLVLFVSNDNGMAWSPRYHLESEPGEYSYPAIIATGDHTVTVTYTWRRQRIAFWHGRV